MGKEEQKEIQAENRQETIEYVSKLTAINQLSEWAISNDDRRQKRSRRRAEP